MATEEDQQKQRPPEPVNITVLRARNLKGSKGDTLNSLVRVEYGSNVLGESAKVDAGPDLTTEYNFNAKFDCSFDDPANIDEIAYKPVLVTFVEVLPKEKKQKEEKTVLLGQCTIDLLPLVKGETRYKSTLQVHPLQGSPLEGIAADAPRPEMDVVVYVNEPLLTEDQLKSGNLITITAETLYSVPESWNPTGTQYMYNVTLPFPLTEERESVVVMSNGVLKAANDKEIPSKQKKWPVPGGAQGGAIYIPDKFVQPCEEQEDGELTSKEDREYRMEAENEKNRVYWNCERRAFLDPSAVQSLQTKIAKTRYWPVEIMRMPMPSAAKTKGKEEDNPIFFHGVAFINMAPLLYPGVKRIRGAYRVHAFTEAEVMEKCKRKGGLADEAARMATNMLRNASPFTRGGVKGGKEEKGGKEKDKEKDKDAATKKQPSQMMKLGAPGTEGASDPDAPPPQNLEGMQYDEARTYIIVEFELESPIVPKRAPEELAKRVAELVPPRPLFPRRTNGAQKAVEDFHHQVASISKLVLEEFRGLFGDLGDLTKSSGEAQEERRRRLIYELNTTGKYFAFKEQLKHSVVKIVREKYLKTSTFEDKEELQAFLSELYVFLVDQMHVGIGKVLSLEDETPVPAPLTDSAQLKHFAREAEVNENFELASKYYQERIARNRNDADHWFDYGCFCLYINDIAKAEECFKETISINQQHLYGLLLYGVVCAMEEGNEAAETFFEAATCVDPSSILAWTMLGLYYDGIDCDIQAEYALMEARRLNMAHAAAKQRESKAAASAAAAAAAAAVAPDTVIEEEEAPSLREGDDQQSALGGQEGGEGDGSKNGEDMSSEKGSTVPTVNKIPATPTELSKNQTKSPAVKPAPPPAAQVKKRMSISSKDSLQSLNQIGQKGPEQVKRSTSATSQRAGSIKAASRPGSAVGEPQQEAEEDGAVAQKESPPVPETTIFMLAVEFLLEVKGMQFCERALAHELLDPMGGPTTAYHVALARLKLQKKALEEANESLNQALVLNYQDPDAWSILGHLRYLQGNFEEAKDCYERTLSFVADAREMHAIYLRLASIYLQDGQYDKSKTTFLLACKNSPSCISWLGVGIACFRLGELSEAEDALCEANILNNSDPEVWGYLSLVCLRTDRQQEAEQAYKYALKVGLTDEGLLEEIHKTQEEVGFGNPQF